MRAETAPQANAGTIFFIFSGGRDSTAPSSAPSLVFLSSSAPPFTGPEFCFFRSCHFSIFLDCHVANAERRVAPWPRLVRFSRPFWAGLSFLLRGLFSLTALLRGDFPPFVARPPVFLPLRRSPAAFAAAPIARRLRLPTAAKPPPLLL